MENHAQCACGAVQIIARGTPKRNALCHCLICRRVHGAAVNQFVIYDKKAVETSGTTMSWLSSPDFERHSCTACGSPVWSNDVDGDEIELYGGTFEPGTFSPQYESWVIRREPWTPALPIPQWPRNRFDGEPIG